MDLPRWKPIGQYRTIPLPICAPPSTLPHRLGYLPAYLGKETPPAKLRPSPVKPSSWVQPKGS